MRYHGLHRLCLLIAALGLLAEPVAAQSEVTPEEEQSDNPWTPYHWTPWNDVGIDAGPAQNGWEGASAVGDDGLSVTVWCSGRRNAVGYQVSYDEALMPRDPRGYSVVTLSVGGRLFNLPVADDGGQYMIADAPHEQEWPRQEAFLRQVATSRRIELVSVADPESGETVFFGSVLPTYGCGAGLERVLAACKVSGERPDAFCSQAFCPGATPVLDHFLALAGRAPEGTFSRPIDEIALEARQAADLTGDDGVYAVAEALCFAPGGIARR